MLKKTITLYMISLLRPTQPSCFDPSTKHQGRRNKNDIKNLAIRN